MQNYDLKPAHDLHARQIETIQCLSVKQPWSWLICAGYKDLENRGWTGTPMAPQLRRRGLTLVHAGKQPVRDWREICEYLKHEKNIIVPHNAPCGGIVGLMDLTDNVSGLDPEEPQNFWFFGPDAFRLNTQNARHFRKPIDYKGQLGFFNVPILGPLAEEIEHLKSQNLWPTLIK